jgi:hypothetical protein
VTLQPPEKTPQAAPAARGFRFGEALYVARDDVEAALHDLLLDGQDRPDDRGGEPRARFNAISHLQDHPGGGARLINDDHQRRRIGRILGTKGGLFAHLSRRSAPWIRCPARICRGAMHPFGVPPRWLPEEPGVLAAELRRARVPHLVGDRLTVAG